MKLLLVSDIHRMTGFLGECLVKEHENVDAVIFTGDGIDAFDNVESLYSNLKFYKIRGNVDYDSDEEEEKVIELCNKKIFITHGHNYNVKSNLNMLKRRCEELDVDIAFYGHTHTMKDEIINGIYYINSGSLSGEKVKYKFTYSIIDITEGGVVVTECTL